MSDIFRSGLAAVALALVHVAHGPIESRLRPYGRIWRPLSAGIAIGYVFLYLLPKMARYAAVAGDGTVDARLFAWALAGMLLFYVVDRYRGRAERLGLAAALHGVGYTAYFLLFGYLVARLGAARESYVPYGAIVAVMALHFTAVDHLVREWHPAAFDRALRWVFAVALLAGWLLGELTPLPGAVVATWTALLAGAILLNVLNLELPRPTGPLWPFLAGVGLFAGVSLLMKAG
jgi:hypothetical protein